MGGEEAGAVSIQYFFEKFSCERRVEGGMEAQEKSEWRKDFLGGGKNWGESQREAASVERNKKRSFWGGEQ